MSFDTRAKRQIPTSPLAKEVVVLLWFFLGWFGAHRFVLRHYAVGTLFAVLPFLSCGVGGLVGWVDGFKLILGTPRDGHGLPVVWSWKRGKLFVDPLEEGTYDVAESVVRILANVGLIFFLPYAVLGGGLMLFETSEVKQTLGKFLAFSTIALGPLFILQLVGTLRKAGAQIALLKKERVLTRRTRFDAIARAAGILTPRGLLVLLTGLAFLFLALRYRWADLGVVAILSLSAFYLVVAASSFLSSFIVRRFSSNLLERGGVVHRSYVPGVVRAGDLVKDTLDVKGVPVPPGFFLTLAGQLPPRLDTPIRHVVPPKSREDRLTLEALVKRTPRGTYDAPPLRIAFTDLLGLTSAQVASLATARLRILPAVRPVEVVAPPPTNTEEPDILTRPHRFPTEDLFRFREYVPGDDTRRIAWEMSLRAGRMIVKTPDSKESTAKRVVVALDTWLPPDWLSHSAVVDDALDALVEAWLALGQRLAEQGEKVSFFLVCRASDGTLKPELIPATGNHAHALDAGARAEWQAQLPIESVLERPRLGNEPELDNAIVVTMRLAPPALPSVARETTWIYYDPESALGPPPRSAFQTWLDHDDSGRTAGFGAIVKRLFFLPHPVGAEENGLFARNRAYQQRLEERSHRLELRRRAVFLGNGVLNALVALPDAVYRLEVAGGQLRVVGLKGSARVKKSSEQRWSA